MAIQIIGVNKLMSVDPDYRSEHAYEILCKVEEILAIATISLQQ